MFYGDQRHKHYSFQPSWLELNIVNLSYGPVNYMWGIQFFSSFIFIPNIWCHWRLPFNLWICFNKLIQATLQPNIKSIYNMYFQRIYVSDIFFSFGFKLRYCTLQNTKFDSKVNAMNFLLVLLFYYTGIIRNYSLCLFGILTICMVYPSSYTKTGPAYKTEATCVVI